MINILVINQNKSSEMMKYRDQYKLFTDETKALEHAKSIGYKDMFGMGLDLTPGMSNLYACGDVKVSILALEVT